MHTELTCPNLKGFACEPLVCFDVLRGLVALVHSHAPLESSKCHETMLTMNANSSILLIINNNNNNNNNSSEPSLIVSQARFPPTPQTQTTKTQKRSPCIHLTNTALCIMVVGYFDFKVVKPSLFILYLNLVQLKD